ncbi:MAG TPA: hypothetical protein VK400_06545 [Pyrinomonadaceae bacterium]|nr:hypothetical protein [Pyrinomonadaceae bacterium]
MCASGLPSGEKRATGKSVYPEEAGVAVKPAAMILQPREIFSGRW